MYRLRDYVIKNLNSIKIVSIFTYFVGIITYYVFIITGYTNSDGLGEGLYYYSHADFHSENGRWAVRFFNYLFGHNVVMPLIIVFLYCTFVIATVFVVAELFSLRTTFSIVLSSSLMITFPPVVIQMTYAHVALTFAGAMFFAVLFIFCESLDDRIINLLGVVPLVICFGLYQPYISVISLMTVLIIIVKLLDGTEFKSICRFALKTILYGIIGTIINTIIYTIDLKVRGLQKSPRLENFDFGAVIEYFLVDIKRTYINFVNFFVDYSLHRWILYGLMFSIAFITVVLLGIKILKEKAYFRLVMVVLFGIFIPLFADVITILIPNSMITEIMSYHYVFLIPFALALIERIPMNRVLSKGKTAMYSVLIILLSTYIISANATYMSYRISYASIHTQM